MFSTNIKGDCQSQAAALLPVRLFPQAAYYAFMSSLRTAAFNINERYNKAEKGTHRFTITDTRGPLRLTVPVSRPHGATMWKETIVSDHGRWFETMPVALESAYGRTPFFEFYIDRMMPLFNSTGKSIFDLCLEADAIVRSILHIKTKIVDPSEIAGAPAVSEAEIKSLYKNEPPYWQVRDSSLGFIGGLSVLDLIFNLGPEAELYLDLLNFQQ